MTDRSLRGTHAVGGFVAAVALAGALVGASGLGVAGRASGAAEAEPTESACVAVFDKSVAPDIVLLGETVGVTETVRIDCGTAPAPLHIVLVLDASSSMAGTAMLAMKAAATAFVRDLDLPSHPAIAVGVVEFNTSARELLALADREDSVIAAIERVGTGGGGGTRIDLGLAAGTHVLRTGRASDAPADEVVIVLSDGGNNAGCDPVIAAARDARDDGVEIAAICLGPSCDVDCMRRIPGEDRSWLYYAVAAEADLPTAFTSIREYVVGSVVSEVTVTDTLGEFLEYVPLSADPCPSAPSDPDRWLQWRSHLVPATGMTFTYTVRPLSAGTIALTRESRGTFVDHLGRSREWDFPSSAVTVLRSEVVPTPGASPESTTTPTARPTQAPTRILPTAPIAERTLYFPAARCSS